MPWDGLHYYVSSPGFPEDDNICNDEEDDNYDNEKNHTATDDKADDSNKLLNSITVRYLSIL